MDGASARWNPSRLAEQNAELKFLVAAEHTDTVEPGGA
jgi:hypothetical protein